VTTREAPHPAAERAPTRRMADAPLPAYESHSSISTYGACPMRYAYRYVERRPGEVSRGQFAFGNAVHHAFESYVRDRIRASAERTAGPGRAVLQAALDRTLATSDLEPDEVDEARRRAVPVLERFLEREATVTAEPVAVELGFGIPVGLTGTPDAIRFVGYIDRVDRALDGSTEILDYKTGRPRSQADVDADRQLSAYAFAAARGALRDPATGETLPAASRLGLYFADAGELIWTTRTAEHLTAFEADLVEALGHIRAREFPARPAPWRCRWCEFHRECAEAASP
jgi:DNA helicase-2/ATP-dependent DNA helicase PcrA